jgi:hypothetical protein
MPKEPIRAPLGVNVRGLPMAGFQLTLHGRIWVTPEDTRGGMALWQWRRCVATQCANAHKEKPARKDSISGSASVSVEPPIRFWANFTWRGVNCLHFSSVFLHFAVRTSRSKNLLCSTIWHQIKLANASDQRPRSWRTETAQRLSFFSKSMNTDIGTFRNEYIYVGNADNSRTIRIFADNAHDASC